jgi:hypothetical protein
MSNLLTSLIDGPPLDGSPDLVSESLYFPSSYEIALQEVSLVFIVVPLVCLLVLLAVLASPLGKKYFGSSGRIWKMLGLLLVPIFLVNVSVSLVFRKYPRSYDPIEAFWTALLIFVTMALSWQFIKFVLDKKWPDKAFWFQSAVWLVILQIMVHGDWFFKGLF